MVKNYSLQFNSSVSVVTLPHIIENVSKLKVQQIRYLEHKKYVELMFKFLILLINKKLIKYYSNAISMNNGFDGVISLEYSPSIRISHLKLFKEETAVVFSTSQVFDEVYSLMIKLSVL